MAKQQPNNQTDKTKRNKNKKQRDMRKGPQLNWWMEINKIHMLQNQGNESKNRNQKWKQNRLVVDLQIKNKGKIREKKEKREKEVK